MKTSLTLLITCSFVFCAIADVVEIGPVQDAYICCCKPDSTNPNGGENFLYQGQYGTCFDRTLIQWELSDIPAGATITDAEIQLYCEAFYGSQSGEPVYYLIEESWDEQTVTFNTQPNYSSVIMEIGYWPEVLEWCIVDITEFVVAWFSGSEENFGIYCHSQNTTGTCVPGFYSSNYSNVDLRPKLVVTYYEVELSATTWASIKMSVNDFSNNCFPSL